MIALPQFIRRPTLRLSLMAILMVVLLPTLGVITMTLVNAANSYRSLSQQRLQETAHILARATESEIGATARLLHGLGNRNSEMNEHHQPFQGNFSIHRLRRNADGRADFITDPNEPAVELEQTLIDLIRHAAQSGEMQVSNYLPSRTHDEDLRIAIANPENRGRGEVDVALVVDHPSRLIRSLGADERGDSFMVMAITDGNGRIISRSVENDRLLGLSLIHI